MKQIYWPLPYSRKFKDLGLRNLKEMLMKIGNPHLKLPPVIHVAGTNGKGSTIAYLKAILTSAGYIVHSYISPHLLEFNERITLAGMEIENGFLTEVIAECRASVGNLKLTFFEGITAAAFLAFSRIKADILLLESGLGGRLDATNIIAYPLISVITPISLDHTAYLGNTVTRIAQEKAGIIKHKASCVISWQLPEVMESLIQECKKTDANYYAWGKDWNCATFPDHFLFNTNHYSWRFPIPSLYGIHQIINAATAIAVINLLEGFEINKNHMNYGLTHTYWPARMQKITAGILFEMLTAGSEIWLDGAHNMGGVQIVVATIENMTEKLPLYLIYGHSKERDSSSLLKYFVGKTAFFCATQCKSESLSEKAEKIVQIAIDMGFEAQYSVSIQGAVEKCLLHAKKRKVRILVCGSLYLAGDFLAVNQGII